MPPKNTRGRGRGGAQIVGGVRGAITTTPPTNVNPNPIPAAHVQSVGVKRPSHGNSGKVVKIVTNHFEMTLDPPIIYHYDVAVGSEKEKVLPRRVTEELFQQIKKQHSQVFGAAAYDGRKNLFSATRLPFDNDIQEFQISLSPQQPGQTKDVKLHRVRFTKTHQEINPEVLRRYVLGQSSNDKDVTVAINCLNVAAAMMPSENRDHSSNGKSIFVQEGEKRLGLGLTLWRGYFQSIRPALGKMVVNVDISTGLMYAHGELLRAVMEYMNCQGDVSKLSSKKMSDPAIRDLSRFLHNVRIITNTTGHRVPRGIKRVIRANADEHKFKLNDGTVQSVRQFYESTYGKRLQHPELICVEVASGAILPMEICLIIPGQIRNAQPPPRLTRDVVEFATKKPAERLFDIKKSLRLLGYGQSPYLRSFGATVSENPITLTSRVLTPPVLTYAQSRTLVVPAGSGAWSMEKLQFWKPGRLATGWGILVLGVRIRPQETSQVAEAIQSACSSAGIPGFSRAEGAPTIHRVDPKGVNPMNIADHIKELGGLHKSKHPSKALPSLLVVILPQNSTAIYRGIKHFGDVASGLATQCVLENKCTKVTRQGTLDAQYYQNLALKINVKLGGINVVPTIQSTANLIGAETGPQTLIMGADAIHPAPGAEGRPSYTSVVGSIDPFCSKYVATCRAQTSKQEIIDDLEPMTTEIIRDFMGYRSSLNPGKPPVKPSRIFMYRDGVSEGQFAHVLEHEVPKIKAACKNLDIDAKITFIVVGKRHHVRFFPSTPADGDKTGNCLAGTVVDQGISHPVEFDFYLQSHAGLLGTSRPAHYNVLLDENNMTPDSIQQLTYTLCHVYARSTRAVSIPAPTYYADIVCSRSANHYDPKGPYSPENYDNTSSGRQRLEDARMHYQQPHDRSRKNMYFS